MIGGVLYTKRPVGCVACVKTEDENKKMFIFNLNNFEFWDFKQQQIVINLVVFFHGPFFLIYQINANILNIFYKKQKKKKKKSIPSDFEE